MWQDTLRAGDAATARHCPCFFKKCGVRPPLWRELSSLLEFPTRPRSWETASGWTALPGSCLNACDEPICFLFSRLRDDASLVLIRHGKIRFSQNLICESLWRRESPKSLAESFGNVCSFKSFGTHINLLKTYSLGKHLSAIIGRYTQNMETHRKLRNCIGSRQWTTARVEKEKKLQ